ncbi:MAG: gluconate 2-dehydrogenase subunit 3 family protein [Terriglobia bacterium]
MTDEIIARRKVLKYLSVLAASAAGQEFLAAWLPAAEGGLPAHALHAAIQAPDPNAAPFAPKFFSPQQYSTVEILTELIIPTDDQPGAKEGQVARFIDFVVYSAAEHQPHLQEEWTEGLALLDKLSREKHGHDFGDLGKSEQELLLTEMSLPEHDPKASHPGFAFYRLVKEMTVEGFYTSKVGLVDVLGFQGRTYLSEFLGCTHPEHQS